MGEGAGAKQRMEHQDNFFGLARVWQVLTKRLGKCRLVWRVSQNGLANVSESCMSSQNGLGNVGKSGAKFTRQLTLLNKN